MHTLVTIDGQLKGSGRQGWGNSLMGSDSSTVFKADFIY